MAKSRAFAADRPSGTAPHDDDTTSAACLIPTRHGRCKGEVVSLAYVGPCGCGCHLDHLAADDLGRVAD